MDKILNFMTGNGRTDWYSIQIEAVQKRIIILSATLSNGRHKLAIMSSSSATNPRSRELLETIEDAVLAVQRILCGNKSRFEMVSFQKYNAVAMLRLQNYVGYCVVCHNNTLRSAGWLLCRYALNGGCPLEKRSNIALRPFKEEHSDLKDIKKP